VRTIARDASMRGNRFSAILEGIVSSTQFQMRLARSDED
jgi:hypothetical protein